MTVNVPKIDNINWVPEDDWYRDLIENFGVEHPAVVGGNFASTRQEAIASLEDVVRAADPSPRDTILDFGCGNLLLLDALVKFIGTSPTSYHGVEILKVFRDYARNRGVECSKGIPSGRYWDVVYMVDIFTWLWDNQLAKNLVRRCARVAHRKLVVAWTVWRDYFSPSINELLGLFDLKCEIDLLCRPLETGGSFVTMVYHLDGEESWLTSFRER